MHKLMQIERLQAEKLKFLINLLFQKQFLNQQLVIEDLLKI
jgi:hypothetical protein